MPIPETGEARSIIRVRQRQIPVIADGTQKETEAPDAWRWGVHRRKSAAVLGELLIRATWKATASLRLLEKSCRELDRIAGAAAASRMGGLPGTSRAARGSGTRGSLPAR